MREGIRAQGHSAVCPARKEELLQGTAKGQRRLEEAERRTLDTAAEGAAKRIKLQFSDRPADPASSGSASSSDFTAEGNAASAGNVVAGLSLKMRLKTLCCRERLRERQDDEERNDSSRRRQNWRCKCHMWRRLRTAEESLTCDVTVGNWRTSTTVTRRCSAPVN